MKNYFFDQRTITFLISLVIAFGLWLLIKLSGDFQTEHNIQLKFQNFPIDKVLINSPDSILNIQTNNNGFGVLGQFVFNRNKSLIVNIENTNYLHTKSGIETYYILGSSLHSLVEDEFKTAEQILDIQPDSIIFKFEKLASKKLKITPQIDLSLNPRFKQYEKMEIIPDSIVFFGPSNLLKSINSINTQKLSLQNIDSSIDTLINLIFPSNKFIGQHTKARLKIAIEEYTEGKISLPIQLDAGSKIRYKI